MNILILGSGGREHALAWKMAASPLTDKLYCAPGNAGIARDAECVALDLGDHKSVIAFARDKKIDLVVVGPEVPLCAVLTFQPCLPRYSRSISQSATSSSINKAVSPYGRFVAFSMPSTYHLSLGSFCSSLPPSANQLQINTKVD